MKVLFMGTPALAAASLSSLIEAGHQIVAAVTRPDAPAGRGLKTWISAVKQVAQIRGVPVLQPQGIRGREFLDQVASLSPDILIVVAYGRILPERLLEVAPLGAVNLHASLLPRYRGAAPVAWAIARGESQTGVTTMRMIPQLDAGDILLQRAMEISPEETAGQLESRLAPLGAALLVETLADLTAGRIIPRPQDEAQATLAPLLRKEDGLIHWERPAEEIARCVRAFDPWPGAHTTTPRSRRGTLRIWRARAIDGPRGAAPGSVLRLVKDDVAGLGGIVVACGEGTHLLAIQVQPEGRRRMPALEAVSGRHLQVGDRLGSQ